MSDDDEWYRILREMNEKDRQAWNRMQERHLQETQALENAAAREATLKQHDAERDAFKDSYLSALGQHENASRFLAEEALHREGEHRDAEITSKFFDPMEQKRLADQVKEAAVRDQAIQQDEAAKAHLAAQELGVADAAREQQAIQQRNAEIIERNNQIQRELEADTLQPVTKEKAEEAIRAQFDERRDEVSQAIAELRQQEIDRTIGGIDDPEMKEYLAQQQKEIEEKYARLEAERRAALEREERARLDRALEPYGR